MPSIFVVLQRKDYDMREMKEFAMKHTKKDKPTENGAARTQKKHIEKCVHYKSRDNGTNMLNV